MLIEPDQKPPIPSREGEIYSTINRGAQPVQINGTKVYPQELATFIAQRQTQGRGLVWRKDLPLD